MYFLQLECKNGRVQIKNNIGKEEWTSGKLWINRWKKVFYENLTEFGQQEFHKFKMNFFKKNFPEKFKNNQVIVLFEREFAEEVKLELIRGFTEKMIWEEGKRFLEFAAKYLEEKEKQEQKQKETDKKNQKKLLFRILNFFKKKQNSNTWKKQ